MQDCKETDILVVATTLASQEDAQRFARELLERRLAACAQVEAPLRSFYRWEGALCEEEEVRVLAKTLPALRLALEAFFAERHPYSLPQFACWTAQGSAAYAAWVRGECAAVPADEA